MKTYEKIEDLFEDGILSPTDVIICWGKRGKGKSSLAGWFMNEFMNPRQAHRDINESERVCKKLRQAGLSALSPPDDHLVFCDTFFEKKGYFKSRTAYRFDALDFGLPNKTHPTNLICPCSKIFFDEVQDLFDSHLSALPTFVTKAIELSRHMKLFLFFISQRPMRIHKDIRELSTFIEVVDLKNKYNKRGRLVSTTWTCNIIYDNSRLEQYLTSKDEKLVDEHVKIKFKGNVFNCFDSHFYLPMFFKERANEGFVFEKTTRTEYTPEFFSSYYTHRVVDIPDSYRGKLKKKGEKENVRERGKSERGVEDS